MSTEFETVIGIEVHAQLLTRTKAFCRCKNGTGLPNTHVCPVCLGLPGALPVLNAQVVAMAVRAGLGLHCTINSTSVFSRKNYFYPDLPKGYQITQFDLPICEHGYLDITVNEQPSKRVGIRRIHIEEDAGKNVHGTTGGADVSLVDLNRAGVPLIEIVSEPDLRSPAEAAEYLRQLRLALMFLGINDGNLEEGSFRCDVNVSVRPLGSDTLGTRCEIKNVNSFRFVMRAIELEVNAQLATLARGDTVRQFTKQFNHELNEVFALREKGNSDDYRYFAEPDLPPLVLDSPLVERERRDLCPMPWERRARYVSQGIAPQDAITLTEHPKLAAYFDAVLQVSQCDAKRVANFVINECKKDCVFSGLNGYFPLSAEQLASLLVLIEDNTINLTIAKELYSKMLVDKRPARELVDALGLSILQDSSVIERACRAAIEENPKQATAYRQGKAALFGFFVGRVMRATDGRAAPEIVQQILTQLLQSRVE
jgi:aspartyl-tRNA(Asn)/glutamyl-tRNA(Gln) amidotransferase subunit B